MGTGFPVTTVRMLRGRPRELVISEGGRCNVTNRKAVPESTAECPGPCALRVSHYISAARLKLGNVPPLHIPFLPDRLVPVLLEQAQVSGQTTGAHLSHFAAEALAQAMKALT